VNVPEAGAVPNDARQRHAAEGEQGDGQPRAARGNYDGRGPDGHDGRGLEGGQARPAELAQDPGGHRVALGDRRQPLAEQPPSQEQVGAAEQREQRQWWNEKPAAAHDGDSVVPKGTGDRTSGTRRKAMGATSGQANSVYV